MNEEKKALFCSDLKLLSLAIWFTETSQNKSNHGLLYKTAGYVALRGKN